MKVSFKNSKGENLVGILEGESDSALIICHGFTDNKDSPLVKLLAGRLKNMFRVLRFDFSGNGESEGNFADCSYSKQVGDISAAIRFIEDEGCRKIGLVGHSMGGASCILASVKEQVGSVVSLAAPVFMSPSRLKELSEKYAGSKVSDSFVQNLLDTDIVKAAEERTSPLLVMHGTEDVIVSIQEAKKLFSCAEEPKEYFFFDADHHFTGRESVVAEKVLLWNRHWLS